MKILLKMKDGPFFEAFEDKWYYGSLLSDVPVSVVLNVSALLIGVVCEAHAAAK